jgi:hypothetical protein
MAIEATCRALNNKKESSVKQYEPVAKQLPWMQINFFVMGSQLHGRATPTYADRLAFSVATPSTPKRKLKNSNRMIHTTCSFFARNNRFRCAVRTGTGTRKSKPEHRAGIPFSLLASTLFTSRTCCWKRRLSMVLSLHTSATKADITMVYTVQCYLRGARLIVML